MQRRFPPGWAEVPSFLDSNYLIGYDATMEGYLGGDFTPDLWTCCLSGCSGRIGNHPSARWPPVLGVALVFAWCWPGHGHWRVRRTLCMVTVCTNGKQGVRGRDAPPRNTTTQDVQIVREQP